VSVSTVVRAGDIEVILETLRGVDRADSLNYNGQQVSFGGGANIMIAARDGYYEDTSGNTVKFFTPSLGADVTITGTALTQDDAFLSSPVMGKIHYTMPSATDLVPSATMHDFKALNEVELFTQVYNKPDKSTLICPGPGNNQNCRISMNWSYTPIIYGAYPAVLYYGQLAAVAVNPMEAPRSKKDNDLPVTLKIDGFRLDHEGFLDEYTNLHRNHPQHVQGIV
jgi:hypothetical protein